MAARKSRPYFIVTQNTGHNRGTVLSSCEMLCQQCIGRTKVGARCTRRTCIGLPYCWQHLRSTKKLRIGDSDVLRSLGVDGKGLYAHDVTAGKENRPIFKKGERIASFEPADRVKVDQLSRWYDYNDYSVTAPYALQLDKRRDVNSDNACQRSVASLANAPVGTQPRKTVNARISVTRTTPKEGQLIATKRIYHAEEILTNYSRAYWTGFRCPPRGQRGQPPPPPCLKIQEVRRTKPPPRLHR